LEGLKKLIANVIPDLERDYDELMRELEHEQAEVAETEAGDEDYPNELEATTAEQKRGYFPLTSTHY
jgi:kinetochore protein Spc7/SPC105